MTRPPPPHPVRLPFLLLGVAVVLGLAGFTLAAMNTGHAITPVQAAGPSLLSGAIPGPTSDTATPTENPLSRPVSVSGVQVSTRTVYRTAAGLTAVRTMYIAGPTQTVTATRTAWATTTVTATATVTTTVTATATTTVTATPSAGSIP